MSDTLVIIPTYNEKENAEAIARAVLAACPEADVLFVDDNSPDGTGQLADQLAAAEPRVHVLHREQKQGLGRAYLAGFRWALERPTYRFIMEMDADFSHDPKYLPAFLTAIEKHDLVLGSRYVPGGGVKNWGLLRKIISRGGSLYARTILGLSLRDLTGGFKCFRRQVLESIDLDAVKSNGYSFQIEMTYRARCKGFRICETPIVFEDRTAGKSKMSRKIFLEAVLMVWKLRMDTSISA